MKYFQLALLIVLPFISHTQYPPGIMVNEFSNGGTGAEEYIELVVVGECGTKVNIQNFIVDDNNGDFGAGSGKGISDGYYKLTGESWTNILVGSIIVIYNGGERNNNIPNDIIIPDSLYILPHDSTNHFTRYGPTPTPSISTYGTIINTTPSWTPLALGNTRDAVQTRYPDGDYFHGVSYGSNMTGGPDNLKIYPYNMGGKNGYFDAGDFRDVGNWSVGNAPTHESPGSPNTSGNKNWIDSLRGYGECSNDPLPVTLLSFDVFLKDLNAQIEWKTATETNNDYFILERSLDGYDWKEIDRIPGQGNKQTATTYTVWDRKLLGTVYYRLTQYDYDGKFEELGIRSLFSEERKIRKIINLMGQEVDLEYDGIKIILYDNGECIKRY